MKTIFGALVVLGALGLASCGDKAADKGGGSADKGGGGAGYGNKAGDAPKPASPASSAGGVVGAWTLDVGALIDVQLKTAMEASEKQLAEAPEDQREMMKGLMPSAEKMREMVSQQLGKMNIVFEFKGDKTCSMSATMPGEEAEVGTGTWTQSGDTVTVTPLTKNGKPAEGKDAATHDFVLKDGVLSFKPEADGPTLPLKRK